MQHRILLTDTVLDSGRFYPKQMIEEQLPEINSRPVLVTLGEDADPLLDIGHVCSYGKNFFIDADNYLVGEFKTLFTPSGNSLAKLQDFVDYVIAGTGTVSSIGVVSDFKMTHVLAVPKLLPAEIQDAAA